MPYFELSPLYKAEDPQAYKKLAETGIMVGYPVSINGKTHREDNGIGYHSTVKFFDPAKDKPEDVHAVASKLQLTPPDPRHTKIEPGMFKDRMGNDVYVIKLHGEHADQITDHNSQFAHMGFPATFKYTPHVSVDKKTWEHIVDSKAQTAHEAGMKFHPAELKQGHTTLKQYAPPKKEEVKEKLAASEDITLAKGAMKNLGTAAAMGVALAGASIPTAQPSMDIPHDDYTTKKMLNTISSVESSGGKFINHRQLNGPIHQGEKAFGKYGLTPAIIRETVRMTPGLKKQYAKLSHLHGDDMNRFMQDNPVLEDKVAEQHLKRLEHHFGHDPAKIGYAWLEGITGTNKAIKEKKNIGEHWHVKKIKEHYGKGT